MSLNKRKLHIEPAPDERDFKIKVAFATHDRQSVDQHFGSCLGMLIYGIGESEWHLLEAIEYSVSDRVHDKLPSRINDISECSAMFCNACGAAAIRQLIENNIQPIKVHEGYDIHQLLSELQQELKEGPSGWLARAMKQRDESAAPENNQERLSQLMDEDW